MKGLYIHIPFCEHICHYCDFVKRVPKDAPMIDRYLDALVKEIKQYENHFSTIETIYIGGGTPSMLSVEQLTFLLDALKPIQPLEFTIEINPESYTPHKGEVMKQYGVNRVSLGVQTFNQTILKSLNRKHTNEQVYEVINHLKSIGLTNISLDLIYALPKQTLTDLKNDLDIVQQLNVAHVSAYSLILEENTTLYRRYLKGLFTLADPDLEANMFDLVMETLKAQGFEHYEIANFAKPNHQSKHNLIYWTLGEYVGCGLGAHGFINKTRTYNERQLDLYLQKPLKEAVKQTEEDLLQDEMIFGLRKLKGVYLPYIETTYKINLWDKYPNLNQLQEEGLIEVVDNYLRLTNKGIHLGNQVFMEFI
ncbi:MAG: radical SAM family heme chaperone HemW [Acholeplasmataceae bacterium]|nr:radical SAM family heme chaperone HemW [Acholeplasmataceae bacterium]